MHNTQCDYTSSSSECFHSFGSLDQNLVDTLASILSVIQISTNLHPYPPKSSSSCSAATQLILCAPPKQACPLLIIISPAPVFLPRVFFTLESPHLRFITNCLIVALKMFWTSFEKDGAKIFETRGLTKECYRSTLFLKRSKLRHIFVSWGAQ